MPPSNLETLFQQFLHHRDQATDFSSLGPWLQHQITACQFPELNHLAFAASAYTRNPITKEAAQRGFEALVIRWDQQAVTPIHGHPAFSFYYVISGIFEMEYFTHSAIGLQYTGSQLFGATDSTWCLGQIGRYDNFIHRVTCLEPGHTFHVYSEDAQKGVSFETRPIAHLDVA
ncbi:hypothetical protein C1752_07476 [Acaryochloris thomasi RCC1774]|uniref:Cysteine dioxygenase n=1 Tax=Acaryochloris thomasi RCC1774 TaxID=1764569 RepID=A0A2W1JAN4_9CYAN|nr:hypothetical protein [Acaryochloris thomasi]PZD71200.1 hypothetical protein C1752_07476 [Acaryochloris thomasi RCC1774]